MPVKFNGANFIVHLMCLALVPDYVMLYLGCLHFYDCRCA